jgi:ketosteroid isomerase-like protein
MKDPADLAIRLRRAAFNRALADADLAAVGSFLSVDAVLVAGTDSAVLTGRKAQLLAWKREFASADRTVYSRIPDEIVVSPVAAMAMEHGTWRGVSLSGTDFASGTYAAKWRNSGADWMLEAEIFLTLA